MLKTLLRGYIVTKPIGQQLADQIVDLEDDLTLAQIVTIATCLNLKLDFSLVDMDSDT